MPINWPKTYTEIVSFKLTPNQKVWLENKAIEQTHNLGREVTQTMVLRALIQKQIDKDQEKKKVWND